MMYSYADSLLDPKNCATKRVSRACDRCRLKKTKCDGRRCCNRCLADDAICVFSKRKRSSDRPYSSEYVQLLEDQQMKLVEGVQELYRRLRRGEKWTGPTIAEDSQGYPLVQDVLDALAILAPSERRNPRKKINDASIAEQDEEDVQSTQYDSSTRIDSASPPLTPLDCSNLSVISSPDEEFHETPITMAPPPSQYQQIVARSKSVSQPVCTSIQPLPNQQILMNSTEFWPIVTSFPGLGGASDYSPLIDPTSNPQASGNWYPGTYMML